MDHRICPNTPSSALVAKLFAIFSMLALALSAVGLYSVVSYGVATRTNEFGIRMALGARARDVVRMVLSATSWNVGAGCWRASCCAWSSTKSPAQWVTESSRDPLILAGVTILLLAVAVLGVSGSGATGRVDRSHGCRAARVTRRR